MIIIIEFSIIIIIEFSMIIIELLLLNFQWLLLNY